MHFWEAVLMAAGSLKAHKLRTFLTLIGIIIGVVAVVAVMSIIEGATIYVATKVEDLGSNTFVIDKFGIITDFKSYLEAVKRNKDIDLADMQAIKEGVSKAEDVGAMVYSGAEVKYNNLFLKGVGLMGATSNMAYIDTKQVDIGRYISPIDEEHRRNVCFIGSDIAKKLYANLDPLGKELKINGLPFQVVGVAKEIGSAFGQPQDIYVIIPISTFQKIYGTRQSIHIHVRAFANIPLEQAQDQARQILRTRHHLKFNDPDDFGMRSADAFRDLFTQLTGVLASVAVGIAAISLVVGGIVIMNIMLVSVTERTREIGVRKSLGARRRDILWQFLVESVLMSAAGGLLGLGVAYALTKLIPLIVPLPMSMPISAVVMAISMSTAVGVIFGIYPAWQAAKLSPIVALRQE
ncbi:MAG: ABC transporter permease [Acidobacteria bacterium]|nr:ABC transporter permease [Acidobacteriota bacterium]